MIRENEEFRQVSFCGMLEMASGHRRRAQQWKADK